MAANHKTGTVLITGASSGIGRATCLYLAQRGYTVIGTSRVASRLDGLREDARNSEVVVHGVEVDINSDSEVERAMPEVISEHGIIDALVNNAGYGLWGPVESLSIDELRAQFETNVFAAVRMTKAVLPGMLAQRRGKIVNVSSVLGRLATPFNGAYASSKFALEGLSESMRTELWPFGVHVSVVEPGLFETDFQANQVKAERSQDPALAYSAYVQRYNSTHRRYEKLSSDPVKVSKVIHKIIRSRRPGFRYPVSIEARAGILGARFLPERLFRWLLSRATMR
jgi:short-subunit dehydrogenase|tara:strand:- start:960 stop:1808 length:849 start_codon:yes stop_codon:yes gene_type:complete